MNAGWSFSALMCGRIILGGGLVFTSDEEVATVQIWDADVSEVILDPQASICFGYIFHSSSTNNDVQKNIWLMSSDINIFNATLKNNE